jgi:hypothetical protein
MELGNIRFRFVLPMVLGFLSLVLTAWDYENNRIVESMGMGWDMGPPFWPYQAVYLFLFTVNVPAFVISMPILKLLNLHANARSLQYPIWFPVLVGWREDRFWRSRSSALPQCKVVRRFSFRRGFGTSMRCCPDHPPGDSMVDGIRPRPFTVSPPLPAQNCWSSPLVYCPRDWMPTRGKASVSRQVCSVDFEERRIPDNLDWHSVDCALHFLDTSMGRILKSAF